MVGIVYLENLRLHAYHGVRELEHHVGNDYVVNVTVEYPILPACLSDDVNDTLNYAILADIVKAEMSVPSKLLEHVAYRIWESIVSRFPLTESATIDIKKIAPPFTADCDGAGVRITMQTEKQK